MARLARLARLVARLARLALLAALAAVATVQPSSAALLGHGGPVRGVAVSADGRTAVTAGFDYSLIVWRLADEGVAARLFGHDAAVNAVALAPDGHTAVSASDDGTVGVWDLAAGSFVRRLDAGAKLATVALSPDGAEVAAGGWDGLVHRWRLADGAPQPALDNGRERVTALAFARDRLLAGGHEGSLRAWRAADGVQLFHRPAHGFGLTAPALLPDGGLVTGSIDRSLRRWDSATGDPRGPELAGHEQPVLAVAASRDGGWLASAGARGEVLLWDAAGGRVQLVLAGGGPPVWSLAFTPDGGRLLGGGADGAVRVWDAATGEALGAPLPAAEAEAPAHGRGPELFAKCSACHTLADGDGGHKAGPTLADLFGRRAGSVAGYPYSPALRRSGIVWTEATVARLFDVGPDRMVPGTKMPLQRMPNARDRADLVAYLKRMSGG